MLYEEWVSRVEKELNGQKLSAKAEQWLYRESFYDAYNVKDACKMALDSAIEFYVPAGGWCRPRF